MKWWHLVVVASLEFVVFVLDAFADFAAGRVCAGIAGSMLAGAAVLALTVSVLGGLKHGFRN